MENTLRRWAWWLKNKVNDNNYRKESLTEFKRLQSEYADDPFSVLSNYRGQGFYKGLIANQHDDEIRILYKRIQELEPEIIVEIGTRDGPSLYLWSQSSQKLDTLVSIDLPGGIHGGGYVTERAKLYHQFISNQPQCKLELIRGNSQSEATYQQLKILLNGRPIDFLFIDGDHRYDGVKRDFELYRDLVRSGGLIGFHDIYPNKRDSSIQVDQLWNEIKVSYPEQIEEIVHTPYQGFYGIGLLTLT